MALGSPGALKPSAKSPPVANIDEVVKLKPLGELAKLLMSARHFVFQEDAFSLPVVLNRQAAFG